MTTDERVCVGDESCIVIMLQSGKRGVNKRISVLSIGSILSINVVRLSHVT